MVCIVDLDKVLDLRVRISDLDKTKIRIFEDEGDLQSWWREWNGCRAFFLLNSIRNFAVVDSHIISSSKQ